MNLDMKAKIGGSDLEMLLKKDNVESITGNLFLACNYSGKISFNATKPFSLISPK